jgi:hypothetical protein
VSQFFEIESEILVLILFALAIPVYFAVNTIWRCVGSVELGDITVLSATKEIVGTLFFLKTNQYTQKIIPPNKNIDGNNINNKIFFFLRLSNVFTIFHKN